MGSTAVVGVNKMSYKTKACNEAFIQEFRAAFIKKIGEIQKSFKICGKSCNFNTISVRCDTAKRFRRGVNADNSLVIVDVPVFYEGLVVDNFTDDVMDQLKRTKTFLSVQVGNNTIDLEEDGLQSEVGVGCKEGSVFVRGNCGKSYTIFISFLNVTGHFA